MTDRPTSPEAAARVAELIRTRRTIQRFEPAPVPPEASILRAVELARWAPNHRLTQPWHFWLLGRETAEAVARLNAELVTAERGAAAGAAKLQRWLDIPGWMAVSCRRSPDPLRLQEDYAACCCAIQNLQLYLWSEGIGVKWTTGAVTRAPRFYELLQLDPEEETVVGLLWYGYPAGMPADPPRKPVDEILTRLP